MSEDGEASRRAVLRGAALAVGGAAAASLAGCGARARTGAGAVGPGGSRVPSTDIGLLESLLDLERHTVAAYTAGIPLLGKADAKTAKQFLDEELEHTGELISLIKAARGKAPIRTAPFDLGQPRGARGVLALLHALEHDQLAAYLSAIPRLSPGPVRAAVATILASDAQHVAVLRLAQGLDPMPSPFVTGAE